MSYFQETTISSPGVGTLRVVFTNRDHAHVTTLPSEGVEVNGVPLTLSLHFYRGEGAEGAWGVRPGEVSRHSIGRADRWMQEASPAGRRKVIAKLVPEIGRVLAEVADRPGMAQAAELTDAEREVARAQAEMDRLAELMREGYATLAAAEVRLEAARVLASGEGK